MRANSFEVFFGNGLPGQPCFWLAQPKAKGERATACQEPAGPGKAENLMYGRNLRGSSDQPLPLLCPFYRWENWDPEKRLEWLTCDPDLAEAKGRAGVQVSRPLSSELSSGLPPPVLHQRGIEVSYPRSVATSKVTLKSFQLQPPEQRDLFHHENLLSLLSTWLIFSHMDFQGHLKRIKVLLWIKFQCHGKSHRQGWTKLGGGGGVGELIWNCYVHNEIKARWNPFT